MRGIILNHIWQVTVRATVFNARVYHIDFIVWAFSFVARPESGDPVISLNALKCMAFIAELNATRYHCSPKYEVASYSYALVMDGVVTTVGAVGTVVRSLASSFLQYTVLYVRELDLNLL